MKIQLFESSIENYTCCVKQFCGCNFELYIAHIYQLPTYYSNVVNFYMPNS